MKIVNKINFEIGIIKIGTFYWKPSWSGAKSSFHSLENGKGFKFVNTRSYYVTTTIQLFVFWWVIYLKIKPELLSGKLPIRYVKFEDTHLNLMDIPHGKWSDK